MNHAMPMSASVHTPYWSKIAQLKPLLRAQVRVDRQYHRGQLWHLLEDRASGRHYRFTPAAHDLIGAMEGRSNLQEIWDALVTHRGAAAPTQDETLRILGMQHAADLIHCEVTPDIEALLGRSAGSIRSQFAFRWAIQIDSSRPLRRSCAMSSATRV